MVVGGGAVCFCCEVSTRRDSHSQQAWILDTVVHPIVLENHVFW